MSFPVHLTGGIWSSVCPIFGELKFDYVVKVVFMAFFLIGEDVTLERRREMRRAGRKIEKTEEMRLRKGSSGWSSFFLEPRMHEATRCCLFLPQRPWVLDPAWAKPTAFDSTLFPSPPKPKSWTKGWDPPGSKPNQKRILVLRVGPPCLCDGAGNEQGGNRFLGVGSPPWDFSRILSLPDLKGKCHMLNTTLLLMTISISQWQPSPTHSLLFRVDGRLFLNYISATQP